MINAFRISKSSLMPWRLHGPIDQALKTTIQADSVRVVPFSVDLGETTLSLELWIDAAQAEESTHSLNPAATTILALADLRQKGVEVPTRGDDDDEVAVLHIDAEENTIVCGPAILTGAGCDDVPECHMDCLMEALMGAG